MPDPAGKEFFIFRAQLCRMALTNLPLAQSYQPTSFAERGIDAPFTAPLLTGARVRPMPRPGIELVVPNPAGGRGVYILPWSSARTLCNPTVHDLRLYEELRRVPALTPNAVRLAARIVARQGLAGQEAQQAAIAADAAEAAERLRVSSLLWIALRSANLPGLTADVVARSLDALGSLFVPIGLPPHPEAARLSRLVVALDSLRGETDCWARTNAGEALAAIARMVSETAAAAIATAGPLLEDARALAADVPALLRQWMRAPEEVAARINRADWVLDGWDRIVLLWREAVLPAGQRAALLEMAQLVPDLPEEIGDWVARPPPPLWARDCRVISLNERWRTGSAGFGLVARNERFRARSA